MSNCTERFLLLGEEDRGESFLFDIGKQPQEEKCPAVSCFFQMTAAQCLCVSGVFTSPMLFQDYQQAFTIVEWTNADDLLIQDN